MNGQNRPLIKPKRRLVSAVYLSFSEIYNERFLFSPPPEEKARAVQIAKQQQQLCGEEIKTESQFAMHVAFTTSFIM